MKSLLCGIFLLLIIIQLEGQDSSLIAPISVEGASLSGLGLKQVINDSQPNRRLFQQNLFWGKEIGVFVVSSETASAYQENYGMEEFIYLLNGRSRLNPKNGKEVIFTAGDHFITPKGYTGDWETQGGDEFLLELSVIATERPEIKIEENKTLPILLDKNMLAGYGFERNGDEAETRVVLYQGPELTAEVVMVDTRSEVNNLFDNEQLIQILNGHLKIEMSDSKVYNYYKGEFLIIPSGVKGKVQIDAHGEFRYLSISRTILE